MHREIQIQQIKTTMGESKHEHLSNPMAVLSLVNGMIGGLILILPLYALNSGYILTLIVIIFTGAFSYYSCHLCLIHMGDQHDLDYAILRHFNGNKNVKIFYDLCVWFNLILINILYFQLIVTQWIGLIPPHQFTWVNPVVNTVVLIILVFVLSYFQLGASLMAYGVISIISYLLFLVWVAATYQQGYQGSTMHAFGGGSITMAAAMGGAFSIQAFFIPVVKKAPNPKNYMLIVLVSYVIGALCYEYIGLVGSIGILHREYIGGQKSQQTIEGYFKPATWEVNIIEAIYLVHLYSVFPEYLMVSKKRMFGVLKWEQSERGKVNMREVIYILIFIAICLGVGYFEVNVDKLIDINGGVIGFFFVYFIPAALHIKCLYFSKGKRPLPEDYQQAISQSEDQDNKSGASIEIVGSGDENKSERKSINQPLLQTQENKGRGDSLISGSVASEGKQLQIGESEVEYSQYYCNCDISNYSTWQKVVDWIFLVMMLGLGIFVAIYSIYNVTQ